MWTYGGTWGYIEIHWDRRLGVLQGKNAFEEVISGVNPTKGQCWDSFEKLSCPAGFRSF